MTDQIQVLPDAIANQIAAGEVIQRPASAVKELLENAVDAGADEVRLFVQESGKALVQVVDNGRGMSETDARICFERHATSKIHGIEDLFRIRTMGFRGEALASIAAVAQVEMKTRRPDEPIGTFIEIENSRVLRQEPCACPVGTSLSMKNLFFNIPARRNFLKSHASELRHITDEFIRVALAFPGVFFSLTSNGQELYHLEKGGLKQRIVQLMGSSYSSRLIRITEKTDYLSITGFAGKPDTARKTRGDQYLFVNNRFIRSAYLNHAVMAAYQDLLPDQSWPMFFLFLDIDPSQVDINVHPTKQEIKFEDEKIIYAFVQSAVKHALAQYSVTPALDFELDPMIQSLEAIHQPAREEVNARVAGGHLFRTFTEQYQAHKIERSHGSWKGFFIPEQKQESDVNTGHPAPPTGLYRSAEAGAGPVLLPDHAWEELQPFQVLKTYILAEWEGKLLWVHQQAAHQQVLYEAYTAAFSQQPIGIQQSLFPQSYQVSPSDEPLLQELIPDLEKLGFLLQPFGRHTYLLQGVPADTGAQDYTLTLDMLLESYKHFSPSLACPSREKLIRSLARQQCIKAGTELDRAAMKGLLASLGKCRNIYTGFDGMTICISYTASQLLSFFGRS